jgi:hypothetical protein
MNEYFTFVLTISPVLVIIYLQWSVSRFGQKPGKVFGFNEFEFANLTVVFRIWIHPHFVLYDPHMNGWQEFSNRQCPL